MTTRDDAEAIFRAAVAGVDPGPLVERSVTLEAGPAGEELVLRAGGRTSRLSLEPGGRIFAAGMGKAAASMAGGLERALRGRLSDGLVAAKEGHTASLGTVRILEAGHPLPDERSRRAALALLDLGTSLGTTLTDRDIVVVLVSGGGSSILCAPAEGLRLEDKAATTALLLASGATIDEMNCVRKHLSEVKGGRLAAALAPARVVTLVLSDVVGDDLSAIASGPTVPDSTTFGQALAIVRARGLGESLPPAVLARLERGAAGFVPETPKPGDPAFGRCLALLVGTNRLALEAARSEAILRGYHSLVLTSRLSGEAREAARVFLGIGKDIAASGFPLGRPACLIAGGETTVTVRGKGRGGRNQEMALAFLEALRADPRDGGDLVFLSAGSDGNDGPTEAAGALADIRLLARAAALGLDPSAFLRDNDSYAFFAASGGHVMTGPTGTNVCDIQLLLVPACGQGS